MQVVYTTSTSAEFLDNFQPNSQFKFNWQQILDENQHSIVIVAYYKDQLVGIANFERISSDRYNFVYNLSRESSNSSNPLVHQALQPKN